MRACWLIGLPPAATWLSGIGFKNSLPPLRSFLARKSIDASISIDISSRLLISRSSALSSIHRFSAGELWRPIFRPFLLPKAMRKTGRESVYLWEPDPDSKQPIFPPPPLLFLFLNRTGMIKDRFEKGRSKLEFTTESLHSWLGIFIWNMGRNEQKPGINAGNDRTVFPACIDACEIRVYNYALPWL